MGSYFNDPLVADAGPDVTVSDDDGDGFAEITLDGRASSGLVTSYQWGGAASAQGAVARVTLPVGAHAVELTVSDDTASTTDTVVVTVAAPSDGGGGKGSGKPCNPKKQVCA